MPEKARVTLTRREMLYTLSLLQNERSKLLGKRRPSIDTLDDLEVLETFITKLENELLSM